MKKTFYIICGVGLLLSSCREGEAVPCTDPAQQIRLRATVENAITMSRAPFNPPNDLTAPDKDNPLKVAVWASTTKYKFVDSDPEHKKDGSAAANYEVALHTKANFTNGEEQLLYDAVYPKKETGSGSTDDGNVYFVGMHPETGWSTTDGTMAQKTFNGSEDVMFAPQISGKYAENVHNADWPTFKFKHLLTWLTVKVKADGEAVSDAWGKIKSLKVKCTTGNTVTIDLGKDYVYDPGDPTKNCVTFSHGEVTLDFYKTGKDDVFVDEAVESTWYSIPFDKAKEVAYVLCPPVIASVNDGTDKTDEYTLIVETMQRTVEVPVDLMKITDDNSGVECFNGSTMGHHFTLNLTFKMGNNIMLTSSADDWNTGGISSGTVSPD